MHTSTAIALGLLALAGCANTTGDVTGDSTMSDGMQIEEFAGVSDLISYLQASGHTVSVTGAVTQSNMNGDATELTVNGNPMLVFEYMSAEAAEEDADRISIDGSQIDNQEITWPAEPHFYRQDNLIALYMGTDDTMLAALEDAMGAQIAGGSTNDEDNLIPGGGTGSDMTTSEASSL